MAVQTEYEGKNVDQALNIASKKLNIPVDEIEYEVLDYGTTGLFGFIGVKKAKIQINLKEDNTGGGNNVLSLVDEAFSGIEKPAKKVKKKSFLKKEKNIKKPVISKNIPDEKEKANEEASHFVEEVSEEAVERGREALEKILPVLSDSFEIMPEVRGSEVLYNLKSDNPGVIIGKKGQNLESIQFLVDKIVNKKSEGRVRVLIDIEDYLERRKQSLNSIALKYADKVKKTGKPSTIGQLSAYERRFIHIALRDDRGVRTQSMGEGYYRKLVVFPSRKVRGRRKYPNPKHK